MRRIALCSGGPYTGKTTLARELHNRYGYIHADHSRSIVQEFVNRINTEHSVPITVEDVYIDKAFWRRGLQDLAHQLTNQDRERLIRMSLLEWFAAGEDAPVVFDPVRTEFEANYVKRLGFWLVYLKLPHEIRIQRAANCGVSEMQLDQAMNANIELQFIEPDMVIDARRTPEQLADILHGGIL